MIKVVIRKSHAHIADDHGNRANAKSNEQQIKKEVQPKDEQGDHGDNSNNGE